jgi:hypothetical protein
MRVADGRGSAGAKIIGRWSSLTTGDHLAMRNAARGRDWLAVTRYETCSRVIGARGPTTLSRQFTVTADLYVGMCMPSRFAAVLGGQFIQEGRQPGHFRRSLTDFACSLSPDEATDTCGQQEQELRRLTSLVTTYSLDTP